MACAMLPSDAPGVSVFDIAGKCGGCTPVCLGCLCTPSAICAPCFPGACSRWWACFCCNASRPSVLSCSSPSRGPRGPWTCAINPLTTVARPRPNVRRQGQVTRKRRWEKEGKASRGERDLRGAARHRICYGSMLVIRRILRMPAEGARVRLAQVGHALEVHRRPKEGFHRGERVTLPCDRGQSRFNLPQKHSTISRQSPPINPFCSPPYYTCTTQWESPGTTRCFVSSAAAWHLSGEERGQGGDPLGDAAKSLALTSSAVELRRRRGAQSVVDRLNAYWYPDPGPSFWRDHCYEPREPEFCMLLLIGVCTSACQQRCIGGLIQLRPLFPSCPLCLPDRVPAVPCGSQRWSLRLPSS